MQALLSKGEKTRLEIVDSAYRLFLAQGYHGTSMRQIAEEAGIALGGMYNHFAGKEEIFEAVFLAKHPYKMIAAVLNQVQGDSIPAVFNQLADRLWKMGAERSSIFNIIFIEIVEFRSQHLEQVFEALFPAFIDFIERIRSLPPGMRETSSPILARTLVGMLISMQVTEIIMGPHFDENQTREYIRETINIYLGGILDSSEGSQHAGIHAQY